MHHYSTYAVNGIACGSQPSFILRNVLPAMAFEYDFLRDGMFGIAALHHRMLLPDNQDTEQQVTLYRARAINKFRSHVPLAITSGGKLAQNDYDALVLMSLLITLLFGLDKSSPQDIVTLRKFELYKGLDVLFKCSPGYLCLGQRIAPLFNREPNYIRSPPTVPAILLQMMSTINSSDEDAVHLSTYCTVLDDLGILYACLRQEGRSTNLGIRIQSWPSRPPPTFTNLLTRRCPRALVIVTYYLSFCKLPNIWWLKSQADMDITIICETLGPHWAEYLEVPRTVAGLEDLDEIERLLLM